MKKLTFILLFSSSMLCANDNRGLFEKFKDWGNEKPNTNFYIFGSSGGVSSTKSEGRKFVDDYYPNKSENKSGGKLGVGYSFNKYFSIEGQVINLGKSSYSINSQDIYTLPSYPSYRFLENDYEKLSIDTKGIGINFVGITPKYNNFSLFGKIGVHSMTTEYKYTYEYEEISQNIFTGYTSKLSSSSTEYSKSIKSNIATFAVGLKYDIQERWFITLEHERFAGLSKGDFLGMDTKYDANLTSFGIGLRF